MVELSQRECEYLSWALKGKTAWETAVILGTSESTAHKMLQSATKKLGAPNKSIAARMALELGLIHMDGTWMEERARARIAAAMDMPPSNWCGHDSRTPEHDPCTWSSVTVTEEEARCIEFDHVATLEAKVPAAGIIENSRCGYTVWASRVMAGLAMMRWDWVAMASGVVLAVDPLCIHSNMFVLSGRSEFSHESKQKLLLACMVGQLDWQRKVAELFPSKD